MKSTRALLLCALSSTSLQACVDTPRTIDPPSAGEGEGEGEGDGDGEGEGEGVPACTTVTGTGAVTFTHDEGATLATTTPLAGTVYTYGLVALGGGNFVAEHGGTLLRSRDHGCTWTTIGAAPTSPMRMAGGGGRAYAWADNYTDLARIDNDDTITVLTPPPNGVLKGMNVNADGSVVVAMDATLHKSTDFGATFDRGTTPAFSGDDAGLVYRAFFGSKDGDHVMFGAASVGARVSFDGGVTWAPSTGLSTTGQQRANIFEGVFSPLDDNVIWAAGIDVEESLGANPNSARHIYRSSDGGLTFAVVATATPEITIINGPMMAASPVDSDVFYFVFGTYYNAYGTDVYRLTSDGTVTQTHNTNHDISAIVFSPDADHTMYFGLVHEVIN